MQATMMHYPLTLNQFLERAGKFHATREIVSRLPDKSLHRYNLCRFLSAQLTAGRGVAARWREAGRSRRNAHVEPLRSSGGLLRRAGGGSGAAHAEPAPCGDEIAYIVNHAEDRFLIVDDVLLPLFEKFKAQIRPERVIVFSL